MADSAIDYTEPEDWAGHMFRTLREGGAWVEMTFAHIREEAGAPRWIYLPHEDSDGIGAFSRILARDGIDVGPLPAMTNDRWKRRREVAPPKIARTPAAEWKMFQHQRSAPNITPGAHAPIARARHLFSELETESLRRRAREHGATLNTLLLWAVSRALSPWLDEASGPIIWEVPVNMRGAVRLPRPTDNHVSLMSVPVRPDVPLRDLHASLFAMLDEGLHWAGWNESVAVGRKGAEALRNRAKIIELFAGFRVGVFSNLGVWLDDKRFAEHGGWFCAPPPLPGTPLGIGCMTTCGRLGVMMLAHERLTTNPDAAEEWMSSWRNVLLSA